MARSRKLFPSYGSALAASLLAILEHDHVVPRFVSAYVAEYDRRGILGGSSRDKEMAETIGREAMMAMLHEVQLSLPVFFGRKQGAVLRDTEREASDAFFLAWMETLSRAWVWSKEDRRKFRRDLDMYSHTGPRKTKTRDRSGKTKVQPEEPPFVGRVALLLDPSMLEQARGAARKFYLEVGKLTRKQLWKTLRPAAR